MGTDVIGHTIPACPRRPHLWLQVGNHLRKVLAVGVAQADRGPDHALVREPVPTPSRVRDHVRDLGEVVGLGLNLTLDRGLLPEDLAVGPGLEAEADATDVHLPLP